MDIDHQQGSLSICFIGNLEEKLLTDLQWKMNTRSGYYVNFDITVGIDTDLLCGILK
jgi:hypothetical protein